MEILVHSRTTTLPFQTWVIRMTKTDKLSVNAGATNSGMSELKQACRNLASGFAALALFGTTLVGAPAPAQAAGFWDWVQGKANTALSREVGKGHKVGVDSTVAGVELGAFAMKEFAFEGTAAHKRLVAPNASRVELAKQGHVWTNVSGTFTVGGSYGAGFGMFSASGGASLTQEFVTFVPQKIPADLLHKPLESLVAIGSALVDQGATTLKLAIPRDAESLVQVAESGDFPLGSVLMFTRTGSANAGGGAGQQFDLGLVAARAGAFLGIGGELKLVKTIERLPDDKDGGMLFLVRIADTKMGFGTSSLGASVGAASSELEDRLEGPIEELANQLGVPAGVADRATGAAIDGAIKPRISFGRTGKITKSALHGTAAILNPNIKEHADVLDQMIRSRADDALKALEGLEVPKMHQHENAVTHEAGYVLSGALFGEAINWGYRVARLDGEIDKHQPGMPDRHVEPKKVEVRVADKGYINHLLDQPETVLNAYWVDTTDKDGKRQVGAQIEFGSSDSRFSALEGNFLQNFAMKLGTAWRAPDDLVQQIHDHGLRPVDVNFGMVLHEDALKKLVGTSPQEFRAAVGKAAAALYGLDGMPWTTSADADAAYATNWVNKTMFGNSREDGSAPPPGPVLKTTKQYLYEGQYPGHIADTDVRLFKLADEFHKDLQAAKGSAKEITATMKFFWNLKPEEMATFLIAFRDLTDAKFFDFRISPIEKDGVPVYNGMSKFTAPPESERLIDWGKLIADETNLEPMNLPAKDSQQASPKAE
jgi:hypothetical protein